MTNILITKNKGNITGFEVSGHSGYASFGKDIVCSAVSAMSQMVCVGLENVLNLKNAVQINEKDAYLKCNLPKNLSLEEIDKAQVLLNSFEQSVNLLIASDKKYKKYINVEVKNEIY